jgi:DNA-binding NarL/FixJ family response regulator
MTTPARPERVLIVDDEPVVRDALGRFLRRSGFEVVDAASVVEALDELMRAARRNDPFDHAVVDLVLGDGDGDDVVRACESLSPRPNIVVLSGNIDSRRALDLAGRCLSLPKPVAAKTLVEALRRRDPLSDFARTHGLSEKEKEALLVAVNGLFNEEAATALGVTKEGLRKRWRQICAKTGCNTPQRVLAKIIRDLIDPSRAPMPQHPGVQPTRGGDRKKTRHARA